jgi:predicted HicB family RNase H-like nuclease
MKKVKKNLRGSKNALSAETKVAISGVLSYKEYVGSIEYDTNENVFHGVVLYINDSILFSGATIEALKKDFEQSIDEYLNVCKAEGLEPNKPMSGTFNIRTSPENHYCLAILSKKEKTSLNNIVNMAITDFIHEKMPAIHLK